MGSYTVSNFQQMALILRPATAQEGDRFRTKAAIALNTQDFTDLQAQFSVVFILHAKPEGADLPVRLEKFKGIVKAMLMGRSYVFQEGKSPWPGRPCRIWMEARRRERCNIGSRHMRMEILRRIREIRIPSEANGND